MIAKIIIAIISFAWVYLSTNHVRRMRSDLIMSGVCRYCESIPDLISKLDSRDKIFLFTYDLPGFVNYYFINEWSGRIVKALSDIFGLEGFGAAYFIGQPVWIGFYTLTVLLTFTLLYTIYKSMKRYLRKN